MLNIYLVERKDDIGWYGYYSLIIAAETRTIAKNTNPKGKLYNNGKCINWNMSTDWCDSPKDVKTKLLGVAAENIKPGIIYKALRDG